VRQRVDGLLERLGELELTPDELRGLRIVEVLEYIATPDAAHLIDELAKGAADARLTRDAITARERLRRATKED
jgi:hypothetical protein